MGVFDFEKPQTLPQWIIFLAATGVTLSSPYGTRQFIKELRKHIEAKAKEKNCQAVTQNLSQALYRLKKRRLITMHTKGNTTKIFLTERGRLRKLEYDLDCLSISRPVKWDRRWRFLLFDIPENNRTGRDSFRGKIEDLGFIQFQKSVWVYPFPCEREIDFVAESLGVAKFITLLVVAVQDDSPLRKHFDL